MPEHFELVEIVPGVHGAISEITGPAVGNAAIIDTGDRTIVVDTFQSPTAAAELRSEALRLTGRSAFLVVNTHWHSDHTFGNQVFADTPRVSTARTVELMIADAPADLSAWEAEIDASLAALRAQVASDDPAAREMASRRIPTLETFKQEAPGFRLTLPDLLFEGSLILEGTRRVEIHTYGGGHTDSDSFVWLPGDRTVISGDLCWNEIHPRTQDGHPGPWADALERILTLGPEHIHPGHGRTGDAGMAEALVPYLRTVAGYVDRVRAGAEATTLEAPEGSSTWAGVERMRTGVKVIAGR